MPEQRVKLVLLFVVFCCFLRLREESILDLVYPRPNEEQPMKEPSSAEGVDGCGCCSWQARLAQDWTNLRANKSILLLKYIDGGLGNKLQGWVAAAMISIALDRAFVLNYNTSDQDEQQMSSFFRSQWWPFAPTAEDWAAVKGQELLAFSTWHSWLQRETNLKDFQSHFPREGPIVIDGEWRSLATALDAPEIVEKVRTTMGGISEEKILPCMANFLFTSLSDRLQQKAAHLLKAIDHSGPGHHDKVSIGVHIRLGDEVLLTKYQQAGMRNSSIGDKRPFDPEQTLRCLDKIIEGIEGSSRDQAGNRTGKEAVLFVAADSISVYDLFIERYGAEKVIITPGEPYHIARVVDDPQRLDLAMARDKAYLDWYLLSKVDILVHNFKSTYSITAGQVSLHTRQINPDTCGEECAHVTLRCLLHFLYNLLGF